MVDRRGCKLPCSSDSTPFGLAVGTQVASDDIEEHVAGVRREGGGARIITALCPIHLSVKCV